MNKTLRLPLGLLSSRCCLNAWVLASKVMSRRMAALPGSRSDGGLRRVTQALGLLWIAYGWLRASGRAAAAKACRGCAGVAVADPYVGQNQRTDCVALWKCVKSS